MLGKLIKYDMKYLNHFLILIHAFLLISCGMIRILVTNHIELQSMNEQTELLFALAFLLCFMILVAISMGTMLFIAARFYKNLFTDEGYLAHTLPVTRSQHLSSKIVSGSIWTFVNLILTYTGIYIVVWTPNVQEFFNGNKTELLTELGLNGNTWYPSLSTVIVIILLFSLLSAIANVIMLYAAIAMGQLFSSHRIIGSIVVYFVLQTVLSLLSMAVLLCFGTMGKMIFIPSSFEQSFNFITYMAEVLKLSSILMLIVTIILYLITRYIMKHKINLL